LLGIILWYLTHREKALYLLDFATFEAPEEWKLSPEQLLQAMKNQECFEEDSMEFMERMLKQSGVGPATAWPPGIVRSLSGLPTLQGVEASREEAEVLSYFSFFTRPFLLSLLLSRWLCLTSLRKY
jgi:3-ketoacyl-CoA synthase